MKIRRQATCLSGAVKGCFSAAVVALIAVCASTVFAVNLPYYDGFNYAEGRLNDVGAPNWFAGSTGPELMVTNVAALTAPEGFPAATGKGLRRAPSGTARRSVIQYTSVPAQDGNEMYASFLLYVVSAPPSTQLIGYLDNNSSSQSAPQAGVFITAEPRIGIGKKSSSPGFTMSTNLGPGVHLVVIRYRFQSGNDRVDLWVDPPATSYGASAPPPSLGYVTGASDPSSLDYFQFYTTPQSGGIQYIDEFRLGRTWADVVPSGGPIVGARLAFVVEPVDSMVNAVMAPVVVQVQTANGVPVASNGVPITLALSSGSGTLSGTLTRYTDETGKAVFDDLRIDTPGTGKQLTATATGIGAGLASAVSAQFSILAPPAYSELTIANIEKQLNEIVVVGGNPVPNQFVQLLGASDWSLPLTNWLIVKYGYFDSFGTIRFTNSVSPALPQAYYRLRTGDTRTKLEPPSISIPPASLIVSPGSTAVFAVAAVGPQLHYLWLFNGVPLWGETNAMLVIPNAQLAHEGNYQVIVANVVGSITSEAATLQVANVAPQIIAHPQDQAVKVGGTAIFRVSATGTAPLTYQWYFNTNTPLPGATNAQLVISNVTTNDAGRYRVVVANAFGTATSIDASLVVTLAPTGLPLTNLVGFAAGVTGGAGGNVTNVYNYTQLRGACRATGPWIIRVHGTIVGTEDYCYITQPNKTIIGVGTNAALYGTGLRVNTTNVIIANLFISATNHSNADGVTIDTGSHGTGKYVWVDHCTFYACRDGSVDITKGGDYVTVSWCKFYYAPVPKGTVNHEYVNLIASSDDDVGQYLSL
ncbi:MAG: immunoglobulin domain-containing protein, partial [Verrucomicrobiae bacterium]|nr:immunoglobulin domain-containing protein [Verrucomicrobiae bacterium]